jgi:hypothetical protein
MATTSQQQAERSLLQVESSGAAVEAVGGLTVIVLAILGLAGLGTVLLSAIAGIVFGIAVLAEGASVASEYTSLYNRLTGGTGSAVELGGGMTVEILGGGAAIVLGILAVLHVAPEILLPALVISGGASLILAASTVQRLNSLKMTAAETPETAQRVMRAATSGATAAQVLAGAAAIVLGIVALASMTASAAAATSSGLATWEVLTLVGLLVLGASIMLSGGSLAGRLLQMFNRLPSQG